MTEQAGLFWTWSETILLVLPRGGSFLISANKGDSKDRGKKAKRGGSGKSNDGRGSVCISLKFNSFSIYP